MDSYLKLFLDSQSLIINQSYPHIDNSSLLPYSCNSLYILYLLKVLADVLYIIYIVYVGPECAFENAVVTLYVHLLYVGIELARYDGCYLVQHSQIVDTGNLYGYNKVQLFVGVPFGCENPVAMAALERVGYRTVALVYDDVLMFVVISQNIIARNRVATVGNDISALQALFGEV